MTLHLDLTPEMLQAAFNEAENETAARFGQQTCSMVDVDGVETCPICDFRARVKAKLGFAPATDKPMLPTQE